LVKSQGGYAASFTLPGFVPATNFHTFRQYLLRIAAALWFFWDIRGHLREGREHLMHLLSRADVDSVAPPIRAAALDAAGWLTAGISPRLRLAIAWPALTTAI
jgi:hypothetical protein